MTNPQPDGLLLERPEILVKNPLSIPFYAVFLNWVLTPSDKSGYFVRMTATRWVNAPESQ